jgi:hypothetical protein
MNMTRHQRRNAAAEARRNTWANWTGPAHRFEDLPPAGARVNRLSPPADPVR